MSAIPEPNSLQLRLDDAPKRPRRTPPKARPSGRRDALALSVEEAARELGVCALDLLRERPTRAPSRADRSARAGATTRARALARAIGSYPPAPCLSLASARLIMRLSSRGSPRRTTREPDAGSASSSARWDCPWRACIRQFAGISLSGREDLNLRRTHHALNCPHGMPAKATVSIVRQRPSAIVVGGLTVTRMSSHGALTGQIRAGLGNLGGRYAVLRS
jgi:hypothetical protein